MDVLIDAVNADGRVSAQYSNPAIYADAKIASVELPLKNEDDYMPLIDDPGHSVWSGYFSSVGGLVGSSALHFLLLSKFKPLP
jgi:hypothetical protein